MPRRLHLVPHLSHPEVDWRYRTADFGVERTHWRIIWLMGQGRPVGEIATIVKRSEKWVREIVHRYNESGPVGLTDRRQSNAGAPPLLSPQDEADLALAIASSAPDGGRWTSAKVADWISARVGRPVPVQRGWVYLRKAQQAESFTTE